LGIIQAIEVTAEGIGRDASDLLRKIKAAQYVASHPRYSVKGDGNLDFTDQVQRWSQRRFAFFPFRRAHFVVDPQGIIQAIEVTAEGIGRDASDLLRKIKAARERRRKFRFYRPGPEMEPASLRLLSISPGTLRLEVWLTAPPSWLTRRVSSRQSKLPLKVSAVMRLTSSRI
jgi:predicted small secreted protein